MAKKLKGFQKVLSENQKKIKVQVEGWDEPKTLGEAVDETVEAVTASAIDALIPVSVTEAAENAVNDLPYMAVMTHYTDVVYSMYEVGLKSMGRKQTMVIPLSADAAEDIDGSDRWIRVLESFKKNTNIGMVMERIPKKVWKKAAAWADDRDGGRAFVIRIPNLLMFPKNIRKNEVTNPMLFDLLFLFVNVSEKSMKKAKKKGLDEFNEFTKDLITDAVKALENFGASSVHFPLWDEFFSDAYDLARMWGDILTDTDTATKPKSLKRLVFSTSNPNLLICFNQELARVVNGNEGSGVRVV